MRDLRRTVSDGLAVVIPLGVLLLAGWIIFSVLNTTVLGLLVYAVVFSAGYAFGRL